MDKLFFQILNMSITASYVILFVIIARLLLKKVPKVFSYALWLVVLFRLICPFSFESMFSLIPVNTQAVPQNIMYSQTPQINSGVTIIDQVVNKSLPIPVVGASANPMQIWIALGEVVWLLGIAILLTYSIFTAIKLYFKLQFAKHISDNIYAVSSIKTPFVFGVFKPKIYLPTSLLKSEAAYIIKHEQTHIKRFDHIIKPLAFVVLCFYWFNPLVWVAFFLMSEDMELSCDESVIKQMGSNIKKDYSTSLLSLSTGRRILGGCPLAFGENNTKGRIKNVLSYKKPAFWVVGVVVIALAAACVGLVCNPKEKPESHFIGFISEFNVNDFSFNFDEVEWVTDEDKERIKELDLNPENDMPNGYYIHNADISQILCMVNDKTDYIIINWGGDADINEMYKHVKIKEFNEYLKTYSNRTPPFRIVIQNGYVKSITEQYVP